jgi:hypothetical protein
MVAIEGVIDFLKAPPIGALGPNLDPRGPYAPGSHTLTTWDGVHDVSGTYGLLWTATTVPAGWGYQRGWVSGALNNDGNITEGWWLQLIALHQLFGGAWVKDQQQEIYSYQGYIRWTEAQPGAIALYVQPGWAVDL